MKHPSKNASPLSNRARELRTELARKIASFMGSKENRATDIPGLMLHRRIAPTAPCSATYEPGVTVIAQGRKRVDLGRTTFIYGESRYLLSLSIYRSLARSSRPVKKHPVSRCR